MKFPYKFRETPSLKRGKKKAFALVLALTLMGFMVLLVVSLATMVQMQMRLTRQTMTDFKAKQAAKFAAYQAMSQIQITLGPDQRITANAKMFDDNVNSEITALEKDANFAWWESPMGITREDVEQIDDLAISQNRYWVGVWNSALGKSPDIVKQNQGRSDYITNTVDQALTWLVSGNGVRSENDKKGTNIKYKPTNLIEQGKYVRAVSGGSYSDATGTHLKERDVLVPIITLEKDPDPISGEIRSDGKETRYAWYVSDEGQKASLNAIASQDYFDNTKTDKYSLQTLPFYSGVQGLTLPGSGSSAGEKTFDIQIEDNTETSLIKKIASLSDVKQLDIFKSSSIPDSVQLSKVFYHDVTFNTKGLLVNVRHGGLKKDLSLGLTRVKFDNETSQLSDKEDKDPDYFERPVGVAGYEYKTSAYPLIPSNFRDDRRVRNDRRLNAKGRMFGPQMYEHEDMRNGIGYEPASAVAIHSELFDDRFLWKDPGGPLWDQLRSYYNLRVEDRPTQAQLSERLQVDDRQGFRPVVKRFQIFFIPGFVDYGNEKWGLRLHIVPLLVLWNPYDTKLGGLDETYYVIRVESHGKHPISSFRFAVGYKSGFNFQCLRDLITEKMPFYGNDFKGRAIRTASKGYNDANNATMGRYYFRLSMRGYWNYSSTSKASGNFDYYFKQEGVFSSITNASSLAAPYMMSRKTGFWGKISDADPTNSSDPEKLNMYYPLGYQEIANSRFNNVPFNNNEKWYSIISEENLVPSFKDAYVYAKAREEWSSRVAKVPLYLNNLGISVTHGTVSNMDYNSRFFYGQQLIDAYNPKNSVYSNGSGALHFLACDKKGIEPGKAKLYAMESIINYLGNYSTSSNNNGDDGPNGVIEYGGKSASESPYVRKKAVMRPLDEGGQIGGCFFLDVPHGETEHQFKYESNFIPWWGGTVSQRMAIIDLSLLRQANGQGKTADASGNIPPTSINDYYVDMENVVGLPYPHQELEAHTPFYACLNMTPIGYGLWSYYAGYCRTAGGGITDPGWSRTITDPWRYFVQHRESNRYLDLDMDIWLWEREGVTFSKIGNNGTEGGASPDYAPLLCYMRGYRFYMGEQAHSFPDPTVKYSSWAANNQNASTNGTTSTWYNGHMTGYTNYGNLLPLAALTHPNYGNIKYFDYDDSQNSAWNDPLPKSDVDEYNNFKLDSNGNFESTSSEINFRARYFLNWLGINPRRHSANYWRLYDGKDPVKGDIVDTAPKAIKPIQISASENGSKSYFSKIENAEVTSQDSNVIPYGIMFGQTDAEPDIGVQTFFNKRLLVNNNILSTNYDMDYNSQEIGNISQDMVNFGNTFGRLQKLAIGQTQVYGTNGDGLTYLGYKVNHRGGYTRVGLRSTVGNAYEAPLYHILRKSEVVSNPANLASAHFSMGVGKYTAVTWVNGTLDQWRWKRSYGQQYPESLLVDFAIGNSLAPSRISPDRSFQVTWLDGASKVFLQSNTSGNNYDSGKYDGKRDNNWYEDRNTLYDMSWHLNNILWDEYFFSTLPYRNDEFENAMSSTQYAMPQNPRIQYCLTSPNALGVDTETRLELGSFRTETEDQFVENAARFWINGPFNINSTNPDAWKTVLSTFYGVQVKGYDGSSGATNSKAPFHRWSAPYAGSSVIEQSVSIDDDTNFMKGYRALSEDEVEELSNAIVENIKDRGPFYSLGHFINRIVANPSAEERFTDSLGESLLPQYKKGEDRLNLTKEYQDMANSHKIHHMQKGVLQAAIDSTSINRGFHTDDNFVISTTNGRNLASLFEDDPNMKQLKDPRIVWENWRGAVGPQATGVPGYLMQQDILSKIGSFITARSDTFKIRAYGEVRNPISGAIEGKAWCEMVVQRLPEYIDNIQQDQEAWRVEGREIEIGSQNAETLNSGKSRYPLDEIITELESSEINKAMGRRFKIVSFRWLNEKEI